MLGAGQGSTSTFSRFCRVVSGHAPFGEYRQRFHIPGDIHCRCRVGHGILQTRQHVLASCPLVKHGNPRSSLDTVAGLFDLVDRNPWLGGFVDSQVAWDPG